MWCSGSANSIMYFIGNPVARMSAGSARCLTRDYVGRGIAISTGAVISGKSGFAARRTAVAAAATTRRATEPIGRPLHPVARRRPHPVARRRPHPAIARRASLATTARSPRTATASRNPRRQIALRPRCQTRFAASVSARRESTRTSNRRCAAAAGAPSWARCRPSDAAPGGSCESDRVARTRDHALRCTVATAAPAAVRPAGHARRARPAVVCRRVAADGGRGHPLPEHEHDVPLVRGEMAEALLTSGSAIRYRRRSLHGHDKPSQHGRDVRGGAERDLMSD